jgi:ketosteroid isomerase-like protein
MSQDNVEMVRRYYATWNRAGLHGAKRLWTEDFEWHDAPEMPDSGVFRGVNAVLAHFDDLGDVMGRMRVEVLGLEAAGNDVIAALRVHIDGVTSGLPFDGPIFEVVSLEAGKVSRIRLFLSEADAYAATGPSA